MNFFKYLFLLTSVILIGSSFGKEPYLKVIKKKFESKIEIKKALTTDEEWYVSREFSLKDEDGETYIIFWMSMKDFHVINKSYIFRKKGQEYKNWMVFPSKVEMSFIAGGEVRFKAKSLLTGKIEEVLTISR